jgi:RNA polymerase sigma-70 factor (ECF subfamily)
MTARRFERPGPGSDAQGLVQQAVARAKEGDPHAFHFLYVRFADEVSECVRSIVPDADAADDISRSIFGRLLTELHQYQPREMPFNAWILRVARNAALADVDGYGEVPAPQIAVEDRSAETDLERQRPLREALRRLPGAQSRVLLLRHIAGLSPNEIAERLGTTEASVQRLYHRGQQSLRAAVSDGDAVTLSAEEA